MGLDCPDLNFTTVSYKIVPFFSDHKAEERLRALHPPHWRSHRCWGRSVGGAGDQDATVGGVDCPIVYITQKLPDTAWWRRSGWPSSRWSTPFIITSWDAHFLSAETTPCCNGSTT